jgi:hypothetical protein
MGFKAILVLQEFPQRRVLKAMYPFEGVLPRQGVMVEKFTQLFPGYGKAFRHGTKQLDHLSQVII